jgi:amidase
LLFYSPAGLKSTLDMAWKCQIVEINPEGDGLLVGKTLAIKDCIAMAGVPFLLGTNMIKDYTPVRHPAVLWTSYLCGGLLAI